MISLTQIGKTTKTHGSRGELKAKINDAFIDALYDAEFVFIMQSGKPVPFFIQEIRGDGDVILKLEDIESPQDAIPLTMKEVLLEDEIVSNFQQQDSDSSSFSFLEGYQLYDHTSEKSALIQQVLIYPDQELAELVIENKQTILAPLHKELIMSIDNAAKKIEVKFPEGLFEL